VAPATPAGRASAAQPKSRPNRILLAAGLGVVAALAALLADKFWLARRAATKQPTQAATNVVSKKSIAVLPFTDLSEKRDQEYFAEGIAEEVLDRLAQVPGLRVVGRASHFNLRVRTQTLPASVPHRAWRTFLRAACAGRLIGSG
jgi:hypothetical protein